MIKFIANKKSLVVTEFISEHSHKCYLNFYHAVPQTRRKKLANPELQNKVKLLFKAGVKPCKVRTILREDGCGKVTQRDLANLR